MAIRKQQTILRTTTLNSTAAHDLVSRPQTHHTRTHAKIMARVPPGALAMVRKPTQQENDSSCPRQTRCNALLTIFTTGNKRSAFPASSTVSSSFNSTGSTAPYSNATPMGSGSTAGAGYGNKTGSFGETKDSTVGKMMEKVGQVVHSEKMEERGRAKREEKGFGDVKG